MDPAVQTRVNLLAALMIAFTLLAVPVFTQVKADTRESVKQAPDTLMSQWFRDAAVEFTPKDQSKLEVEDAWAQRAQQQNPACTEQCNPDGDLDGDGVSNEEELRNGSNPACDERKYGEEFCAQQDDQFNVTRPDDPNSTLGYRAEIYNFTWGPNQNALTDIFELDVAFDVLHVWTNVTYDENGYLALVQAPNGTEVVRQERGGETVPTDGQEPTQLYEVPLVPLGNYTVRYQYSGGLPQFLGSNVIIEIHVDGIIFAAADGS